MKGVIIASHGKLAEGLLDTAYLFFGPQQQLEVLTLNADDNVDTFFETLKVTIPRVDTGDGVIILVDVLYGSPCNCISRLIYHNQEYNNVDVITGVNLPMLMQVLSVREYQDLLAEEIITAGNDGICYLNQRLNELS